MQELTHRLYEFGVVPVIKIDQADRAADLGRTLVESGLPVAEVTLRTPQAIEAVTKMRKANPGLLIGIGTVLTTAQAGMALDAGADFIVSPNLSLDVSDFCKMHNIPHIPGVFTPSEMHQAMDMGAEVIKYFPANFGGPKMIKTFGDIFGDICVMPTGGISEDNLSQFLAVPQVVCCGGSYLAPAKLIEEGDFSTIAQRVLRAVKQVAKSRQ